MLPEHLCLADKGYQGILSYIQAVVLQPTSCAWFKLVQAERQHNRNLARLRVVAEQFNVSWRSKRILGERYRNWRKRFSLRFNLSAAIINSELVLSAWFTQQISSPKEDRMSWLGEKRCSDGWNSKLRQCDSPTFWQRTRFFLPTVRSVVLTCSWSAQYSSLNPFPYQLPDVVCSAAPRDRTPRNRDDFL